MAKNKNLESKPEKKEYPGFRNARDFYEYLKQHHPRDKRIVELEKEL